MFNKFFILLFFLITFFTSLFANQKELIINKILKINNITYNFEQTTNKKKEIGSCVLFFNNKIRCIYKDKIQKEIIVNGKTLVIRHNLYDKNYYYPISKSPLSNILNKENLINLIRKSNYKLNDNIELTYLDKNSKTVVIFFDKNNYNLVGWEIEDQLQNKINFSLKINFVNSDVDLKIFKIPVLN